MKSIRNRCKKALPEDLFSKLYFRIMDNEKSYPLTGSGKRSIGDLTNMPLDDAKKLEDGFTYGFDAKRYILKR